MDSKRTSATGGTRTRSVEPSGTLPEQLWDGIADTYQAILDHPFLLGLADGTLSEAAFRFYVVQDALYLTRYARALAICAARAPRDADIQMFSEHAAGAVAVERSLHEGFLADLHLSADEVVSTPLCPTNLAYTSYLLATAYGGSFAEALGVVLPCYWIYWEVGKALAARGSAHPLYQRWIDTYAGDDFGGVVRAVLELTNRVDADLGAGDRRAMTGHFIVASRYEWMFWDAAWRQEPWPLASGSPS